MQHAWPSSYFIGWVIDTARLQQAGASGLAATTTNHWQPLYWLFQSLILPEYSGEQTIRLQPLLAASLGESGSVQATAGQPSETCFGLHADMRGSELFFLTDPAAGLEQARI